MRNRRFLAVLSLAVLLLVLVPAAVYLLAGGGDEGAADAPGTAAVGSAARPAASTRPDEEESTATLVRPTDPGVTPRTTGLEEDRGRREQPAGGLVVRGRVELQAGTPEDEELRVVALPGPRDVRTLAGGATFAAVWGGRVPSSASGRSPAEPLAHARLDEDGSFRLVLPESADTVHLAVSARYHYSERTTPYAPGDGDVVLTPRLGAWITGTLEPAADAPELAPAGVVVGLFPDITSGRFNPMEMGRAFTSAEAVADEEGRFEFRGVPAGSRFGAIARTETHAMPYVLALEPEQGRRTELTLTAGVGATVRGRVVDGDGEGVAEVEVVARPPGLLGQVLDHVREVESADDGSFELSALPAGELELSASGGGHLDATLRLEPPLEDGEVRTGVELAVEAGATMSGTVRFPDGTPGEGASVVLERDLSALTNPAAMGFAESSGGRGTADAEGAFTLTGLAGGPFLARASLLVEDGERAGSWSTRVGKIRLDDGPLELRLERELGVRVRVTDLDGEPLPAYSLRATLAGTAGMFGMGAETASASVADAEDGVGELTGLAPGDWELVVDAAGHARSEPLAFTVPRDATPLAVTLAPTGTVVGTVVDGAGTPVGDARVTLALDMANMFGAAGQPPLAVTDAEGRFTLQDVEPGTSSLVAEAEGYAASEAQPVELAPGATVEGVVLTVRTGGTIRGLVLGDGGEPQSGRMIVAQRPPDYARQRMDRSDTEGRFLLERLEPGRWQVTSMVDMLSGDGPDPGDTSEDAMANMLEGMQMGFAEVVDGEVVELVLGERPAEAVNVRVRVVAAGEPVRGAMVSFVAEDQGEEASGSPRMSFKVTGADGLARVELDGPGAYLVSVQQNMAMGRQSVVEFVETIPETEEEHELELELPVAAITGRVHAPDGEPLPGARVTLTVEGGMTFGSFLGGNYAEVVTDEDGGYVLENLRPGTYTVAAGGSTLGGLFGDTPPGGRVVRGGVRVTEGQVVDGVDFRLEEPGTITGLVRDSGGAPVAGASVFVRDADGRMLERFSFVATGEDGRFRYTGVQPGRYFVSARAPGRASHESAPVTVAAGESAEVALRVEAGTMLLVQVVDRSDADVQARVSVTDPNGHEVAGLLSMTEIMEAFGSGFSSKVQRIGPLAPGRYEVRAVTGDGREADKPVVLDGRPERKLTLRLR